MATRNNRTSPYKEPDLLLAQTLKKANYQFEVTRRKMQLELKKYETVIKTLEANAANPNIVDLFSYIESLYNGIDKFNISMFEKTAKSVYTTAWEWGSETTGQTDKKTEIDRAWILALIATFNAVTKYVYTDEVKAKSLYFNEKIEKTLKARVAQKKELTMFGADVNANFKEAKRLWANMSDSMMMFVGTLTMVQAYNDTGVKKVVYHTEEDNKVCPLCQPKNGTILSVDELVYGVNAPPIHNYCRCWLEPIE